MTHFFLIINDLYVHIVLGFTVQVTCSADTAATSQQSDVSLETIILLTRGAFVTPRSVIKNMTTKKRPHAEEIIKQMKSLEEKEVGNVKNITRTQINPYHWTNIKKK